ncbi:MAG: glycosyltransferase [Opitutae bacterium]|nr:glycosyltransferase [Opitutae bacterium]
MNENDAYIFDVEQPRDWVFAGEPVWVAGWFVSKIGTGFSDIRAMIDGVPHLGILGLPRPEIEARYRPGSRLPHAGFLLRLQPHRGAREVRLELLDADNHWTEFWRTPIRVKHGPRSPGRYQLGVLPDHAHVLLQALRADPSVDLAPLADTLIESGVAVPLDTLPNPPFFGALEKPELVGGVQYGKVRVEGWLIHREQRIRRLIGSTHPSVENEFSYGDLPRPEAAELFPGHPHAARSQYFGLLDIDENVPGPAAIKMFAELEDGTSHLVFTRRFYPRACHLWERPLPAFDRRVFLRCVLALRAAAQRRRVELGPWSERWTALRAAHALYRREAPATLPDRTAPDTFAAWQRNNRLSGRLTSILRQSAAALGERPRFQLLVDARDCTDLQLSQLATSLAGQLYPNWEAHFVGAEARPGFDPRCRWHPLPGAGEIAAHLNTLLRAGTAELVTLLPGDARLSPDALVEIAERFAARPELELVYTDEDAMDDAGSRSEPCFKPEWSPALLLSGLFPGHLAVVRREKLIAAGAFRPEFAHVAWFDALLRLSDRWTDAHVAHVAQICYHRRAGRPGPLTATGPAIEEARLALVDTMIRRHWSAAPFLPAAAHARRENFHQLRWSGDVLAQLPVTIVIPTRDRLHLLQECVELLEETVDWRWAKLVIVDDHSRDTDALRYLERIQTRPDLRCVVVRTPDAQAPFNYSRLVNAALPHIDTPLVLHLNNDIDALEPGWLEEMAAWFRQPDVGVVGAKLVFPDRTLNHTGILIGPHGGLADTPWARRAEAEVPPLWHAVAREVSAVTGACLLTRADLYRQLGGFEERDFGVAYNDVDYCLRARAAGYRVIYTPQAKLMHFGSATRGVTFDEAEHLAWLDRYAGYRDACFSRQCELHGTEIRCAPAAGGRPERARPLEVLLLTHNLNLEGAPLFLREYATHLVRAQGWRVTVLAGQDGPLRSDYQQLGAEVIVADEAALLRSANEEIFHQRLGEISGRVDWDHVDLVVANTLLCFWGVLLARRADRPSLLYIHESTSVFRAFETKLALPLHSLVHEALQQSTRTLFLCEATRRYHADDDRGNFAIVPSWIDLAQVQSFRATHDRAALRRKHGLRDDEVVVANIGTVCERKGQHVFLRAIAHFNRHYRGAAPVRFLLVGARPGIYLELIERDIAALGLTNLTLVPETREAFDFFAAADLFVCTSFEESFPRVVMEAMAFRTPIVSTDVHGIPQLIGQRQDGYLVPPGNAVALSRLMLTCLAKERSGKSLAPAAHSKIRRFHDGAQVLPRHADLAREAWLAHD